MIFGANLEWLSRTATLCRWLGSVCQPGCALFFNFGLAPGGLPLKGTLTLCTAQRCLVRPVCGEGLQSVAIQ